MINIYMVHEITTYINNIRNVPQKTTHVTADSSADVPPAQTPREQRKENWKSGLLFAELFQPSLKVVNTTASLLKPTPQELRAPFFPLK